MSTILEFNNIGSLVKLDPNAYKRNWAKFARFCINLDCSQIVNTEIMIPNEIGELKKYCLWFEDIPKGCGNCGELDHGFNNCPLRRFVPPKFQIKFRKQVGETSKAIVKDPSWVQVQGKMNKKKATKMEKVCKDAMSKCSSERKKEINENNGDQNNPDDNQIEDPNKEVIEQVVDCDRSTFQAENTTEGMHYLLSLIVSHELIKSKGLKFIPVVLFPAIEDESKFISNMQEEFYYDGDDEGGNFEMDYLMDEVPFLEDHIDEAGNMYPLPDFPLEEEVPFFPMNTENLILNQASIMESILPNPSSSGSSKRKLAGGEGDTASSGVGNKKPKNYVCL